MMLSRESQTKLKADDDQNLNVRIESPSANKVDRYGFNLNVEREKFKFNHHSSIRPSLDDSNIVRLKSRKAKINFNKNIDRDQYSSVTNTTINNQNLQDINMPNNDPFINRTKKIRSIYRLKHLRNLTEIYSDIRLSRSAEFLEDLRKHVKTYMEDEQFLSSLLKRTGITKQDLHVFVHENNIPTFDISMFVSLLDFFHLMILIIPK